MCTSHASKLRTSATASRSDCCSSCSCSRHCVLSIMLASSSACWTRMFQCCCYYAVRAHTSHFTGARNKTAAQIMRCGTRSSSTATSSTGHVMWQKTRCSNTQQAALRIQDSQQGHSRVKHRDLAHRGQGCPALDLQSGDAS